MTRRGIAGSAFLAAAVAALLWLPSSASARPRISVGRGYYSGYGNGGYEYGYRPSYYSGGYYGYGYGYGPSYGYGYYRGPRYYSEPYYTTNYYTVPEYVTSEPNTVTYSTSSYRADTATDDRALVTIQIPGDQADIWIQGEKSTQTKSRQDYLSPPLTPGKKYYYEVRARWREGERNHDETRNFAIIPGKPVLVDFTKPATAKP
jgi:uncharacterized protein (TIGR03000 family)